MSTVREVLPALGTPWIYPWGAVSYGLVGTISGWMSEDFSASPETVTQDFVDFYNLKIETMKK